jgi:hypothetical protein
MIKNLEIKQIVDPNDSLDFTLIKNQFLRYWKILILL